MRESDVLGRLGGDEFVALLTDATEAQSSAALGRLERAMRELNESEQRGYDIAFSAGVLTYAPSRHKSIDDMLAEADALMYERKRAKRAVA